MRDLFIDGVDPDTELASFTAFFNPNSGGSFDAGDWAELMTKPTDTFYRTVDSYWNSLNPYPGKHVVWREPGEVNGPTFSEPLFNVIHPITGVTILEFGIR